MWLVFAQDEVIDAITLGNNPFDVAYNVGNSNLYATIFNSRTGM